MKVLIGTKNPGKIEGAKLALSNFFKDFEIEGIKVPSNVPDQPVNEDTYNGAKNFYHQSKKNASFFRKLE